MSEEAQKTKRYQVFEGKEMVYESHRKDLANKKVLELKESNKPIISIKDIKQEKTTTFFKTRNEKNYRVR